MRAYWILALFCTLMSVGLLMVILGQHREMDMITRKSQEFDVISQKVYDKLQYEDTFKDSLQKLVTQGQVVMKDLEAAVAKLEPEVEMKKKEDETCQAELKPKKEEVGTKESENSKTTDALKAEADTWKKEIETLTAQMKEESKICAYVAEDKKSKDLCNKKNVTEAAAPQPK